MAIDERRAQYGALFDDWNVSDLIGTGSNGRSAVFEMRREFLNGGWEYSALKVMTLIEEEGSLEKMDLDRKAEYLAAADEQRQIALQEVRLMEQLRGKTNIVDYQDYKFINWQTKTNEESAFGVDLLIRMEKLTALRSELKRKRVFTEAEVVEIGKAICQALVICHGKNIVHRDIKPENIFFNADGDYKLGDFGVSRVMSSVMAARAGTIVGTPAYAAPEQFSGNYDKRVDIYSLGLVLYELSNGNRLPFASSYITEKAMEQRLTGSALPAPERYRQSDPNGLWAVIRRACAYRPEDRYQDAVDMLNDLNALYLNKPPVQSVPAPESDDALYQTTVLNRTPTLNVQETQVLNNTLNQSQFPLDGNQTAQPPEQPPVQPTGPVIPQTPPQTFHEDGDGGETTVLNENTKGNSNMKLILIAAVAVAAIAIGCIVMLLLPKHTWTPATCTTAELCTHCGKTKGQPLGHRLSAADCVNPAKCAVCGATEGTALGHDWQGGTCTEAPNCSRCDALDNTNVGHKWQEATCESPKTCSVCDLKEGDPLGHQWTENLLISIKTCSLCGTREEIPIIITLQPKDAMVKNGEDVTLTVEAKGEGLTYEWWASDVGDTKFFKSPTFTSTTYTVTMSDVRNGRRVYCVITDKNGNTVTSNTATLTMEVKLEITGQPTGGTVANKQIAKATVKAVGNGLTYEWWILDPGNTWWSKSSVDADSYTFTMSADKSGRKVYCVVRDVKGKTVSSKVVTFNMECKMTIKEQPENVKVAADSVAKTTVKVKGDKLSYTWWVLDPGTKKWIKSSITEATYSCKLTKDKSGRQVYCVITDKSGNVIATDIVTLKVRS